MKLRFQERTYMVQAERGEYMYTAKADAVSFRRGDVVLKELRGRLRRRGSVAVIGPRGSGKTTLLAHLANSDTNLNHEWIDLSPNFHELERAISNLILKVKERRDSREHLVLIDDVGFFSDKELKESLSRLLNWKAIRNVVLASERPIDLPNLRTYYLRPIDEVADAQSTEGLEYFVESETSEAQESIILEIAPRLVLVNDHIIEQLKRHPDDLYKLRPRKFEELICELLTDQGCEVEITQQTRDGGKDIIASMSTPIGKVLTLVEAKRHKPTNKINVGLVRQLYGVLYDHNASHGMFVTSSVFTKDAQDFQKRHEYELSLKEYKDIANWIEGYKK